MKRLVSMNKILLYVFLTLAVVCSVCVIGKAIYIQQLPLDKPMTVADVVVGVSSGVGVFLFFGLAEVVNQYKKIRPVTAITKAEK